MNFDPNKLASKHTPGPWHVTTSKVGNKHLNIVCSRLGSKYKVAKIPFVFKTEEALPDAHLISASPEAIGFIADLMPTFEVMKATGLFDAEAVDKVIADAETILKKAYNL